MSSLLGAFDCTMFYTDVAKTSINNFRQAGTAFSGELPQARTVLLFGLHWPDLVMVTHANVRKYVSTLFKEGNPKQ